ncbi:MAG: substrate-binding domain-containing protein, partial [Bdellovibrionia bacterium]
LSPSLANYASSQSWDGPRTGPVGQTSKSVIYIGSDFKNGGVAGVYRQFQVAAKELGWNVSRVDGKGDLAVLRKGFFDSVRSHPDGIVLGGFQADEVSDLITHAKKAKIILVGWHSAEAPGPTQDLFVNISTDAMEIASIAAQYAINIGHGKLGVVFFNDSRFDIANLKTKTMRKVIKQCKTCKVLSVEDLAISKAGKEVPAAVTRLNKKFGHAWTHTLAINDVYFDHINFPLKNVGRDDIVNISAGDGSQKALSRIRSGLSQQVATVAEPLSIQGWQLADELNRAFAGKPPSGYVTKPMLITTEVLQRVGEREIESRMGYREAYRAIWRGKPAATKDR